MMLATRCPYCRTMFRVVQDQLKICNGIVRCGSCRQVFNGIEQLQSADAAVQAMGEQAREQMREPTRESAPASAPVQEKAAGPMAMPVRESAKKEPSWPASAEANPDPVTIVADPEWKNTQPAQVKPDEVKDDLKLILTPGEDPPVQSTRLSEPPVTLYDDEPASSSHAMDDPRITLDLHYDGRQEPGFVDEVGDDGHRERDFVEELSFPPTQLPRAQQDAGTPLIEAEDDDPAYTVDIRPQAAEPAFVQRAKKQERYGRMGKIAMALLIVGLLPALFLQTVDAFHLRIGAMFPGVRPVLVQVCSVMACQADLPAHIESVSIDSNELRSPTKGDKVFTLNVLLRNRSQLAQAWPNFELTLKDATETPIVRRVFGAREYLNGKQEITKGFAPNSEYSVKLQFEIESPLKPVGYEVYLFYS